MRNLKMLMCPIKMKVLELAGCVYVDSSSYSGKEFTYTFETDEFLINDIDERKSRDKVQNRAKAKVDNDVVSRYEMALEKKCEFPAIIIFQDGNNWLVADGNHTTAAAKKLGIDSFSGIFKFSHPRPVEVAATFNVYTTGHSETMGEVLERAVREYRKIEADCLAQNQSPPTQKSWAEKYLIPESRFNQYFKNTEIKRLLSRDGINIDKFDESTILSLGKIRNVDVAASIEVAKMANQFKMKACEIANLKDEFLDPHKTALQKQKVLEQQRDSLKFATNNGQLFRKDRPRRSSKEATFKESLTKLANLSQKVNPSVLKALLSDKVMSDSVTQVQKFLKSLVD